MDENIEDINRAVNQAVKYSVRKKKDVKLQRAYNTVIYFSETSTSAQQMIYLA